MHEKFLNEPNKMVRDDSFSFECASKLDCFNVCCADVNIVLTPYDVLRMKRNLGISSEEFLAEYTFIPFDKESKLPVVLLRMSDDEKKVCPFVKSEGCSIYSDRPWACRMYPVGMAAQKDTPDGWGGEKFYFLLREDVCKGFGEDKTR